MIKVGIARRSFLVINALFVILVCLSIALPMWMVLMTSFASNEVAAAERFVFIPKGFELTSYQAVFSSSGYTGAFWRSVWITVAATALSMALTTTMAYALAQRDLMFRNFFMNAVLITMVVDGGIIPFYMVVKQLGMIDTYYSLIIPMAITTYNLILMRNFFRSLPESLMESGRLDGCSEMGILVRIVLPISVPILAAILLFYAVGHWNRYFEVIMFINSSRKYTLQVLLRQLIFQSEGDGVFSVQVNNFKMAVMMITMLPILALYPFIQKYFISGLMLGSVKG